MKNHRVNFEKLLYRILLGYYYIYVDNKKYKVITPNLSIKYESELFYDNIIEENKFDQRLLTLKEIEKYLITNGVWNLEYDAKIKELENQTDDIKVDIYLNFYNASKKKFLEKNLESVKKILSQLYEKKNCLNHLSIEEYALFLKNEFILANCIYNTNNELVFNYHENLDYLYFQKFIQEIMPNIINHKDLRDLAKTELWKSYASSSKIEVDILTINDDYKLLISFHNMFHNIRQHPECPSEDIISDDNALDGWCINQNRKAEKDKKKQSILDKVGGSGNKSKGKGQEEHIFVFTNNEDEIKAINDLNDTEHKIFKKEVAEYSKHNPGTKWEDLPPIKRKIQMEAQKMTEGRLKNKQEN